MVDNERDRWGDKLRENERAREEQYFAERERELLAKLRKRAQEQDGASGEPVPTDEKKGNG